MYRQTNKANKTTIKTNAHYEGEPLEKKIARVLNNKEPITDGSPPIYTERKDGVIADYDIRTDRFEVAAEAMGAIAKSNTAKREMSIGERAFDGMTKEDKEKFVEKYPKNRKSLEHKAGRNEGNQGT